MQNPSAHQHHPLILINTGYNHTAERWHYQVVVAGKVEAP